MRMFRTLAAPLAVLVLAPALVASPASKALATLKAATKAHLKEFKQAGATALKDLDTALDAVDGGFTTETTPSEAADSVTTAVTAFMQTLVDDHSIAVESMINDADIALQTLAGGGYLLGIYPDDFYFGTGGAVDDGRATMDKEAGKLRAAAMKRIGKTFAKAEAAGLGFALHLRAPARDLGNQVDQGGGFGILQSATIDFVLTVSRLSEAHDGVMVVSGPSGFPDDVTVIRGHFSDSVEVTVPCDMRFTAKFTDLLEGGWTVGARQASSIPPSTESIGVR